MTHLSPDCRGHLFQPKWPFVPGAEVSSVVPEVLGGFRTHRRPTSCQPINYLAVRFHFAVDPVGVDRVTDSLRSFGLLGRLLVLGFTAMPSGRIKVNRLLLGGVG